MRRRFDRHFINGCEQNPWIFLNDNPENFSNVIIGLILILKSLLYTRHCRKNAVLIFMTDLHLQWFYQQWLQFQLHNTSYFHNNLHHIHNLFNCVSCLLSRTSSSCDLEKPRILTQRERRKPKNGRISLSPSAPVQYEWVSICYIHSI
jgi:hypothetical protein